MGPMEGRSKPLLPFFNVKMLECLYMNHLSKSAEDTKKLAQAFLDSIEVGERAVVVALKGDLGAGKTAFAQAVGEILGVGENMHSPTFVIQKVYSISWRNFKNLIHIDAYRLDKESELLHLGWEKIIEEPENLILLEWPERVSGIIPESARCVCLKFIDETTREISFSADKDKEYA